MKGERKANAGALARLEMAREKARITGRKPALPSRLERGAQEWKGQREQRERLRLQAGPETSVVSPQRIRLTKTQPADEGIQWRAHRLGDDGRSKPVAVNAAMVSRIAQHLKAREWARATGKRQSTPLAFGLEQWAERWSRNKQLEDRGLAGSLRTGE